MAKRKGMKNSWQDMTKDIICTFYMKGCCTNGSSCRFSHQATPFRKMEPCKFYQSSVCSRGDSCLFMHQDFPCKFFTLGNMCYNGDKCRFSHAPLTDVTRVLLMKFLESSNSQKEEPLQSPKESRYECEDSSISEQSTGMNTTPIDSYISSFYQDTFLNDECNSPVDRSPSHVLQQLITKRKDSESDTHVAKKQKRHEGVTNEDCLMRYMEVEVPPRMAGRVNGECSIPHNNSGEKQLYGNRLNLNVPVSEICASETSHPPIEYRLTPVFIPNLDYSHLGFKSSDSQMYSDPRLRRLYSLSQNCNPMQ